MNPTLTWKSEGHDGMWMAICVPFSSKISDETKFSKNLEWKFNYLVKISNTEFYQTESVNALILHF